MKAIICSAGMGTRLGMQIPKALIRIRDKYLIEWQLEALREFDTTVIIGYKSELIIPILEKYQCRYIINQDYTNTNTSHSIGLVKDDDKHLILDGDLLFTKEMINGLHFQSEWVGVSSPKSEFPVYINPDGQYVLEFTKNKTEYEWACMCYVSPTLFSKCTNEYVYEILTKYKFLWQMINIYEIDTPKDLDGVDTWMNSLMM